SVAAGSPSLVAVAVRYSASSEKRRLPETGMASPATTSGSPQPQTEQARAVEGTDSTDATTAAATSTRMVECIGSGPPLVNAGRAPCVRRSRGDSYTSLDLRSW